MNRRTSPRIEKIRTQERAKDRAMKQGMKIPTRPRGEFPELQEDDEYGEWSDHEVIKEMQTFTRWTDYLTVQLALAEITEATADRISRRVRDVAMLQVDAPKGQVLMAKADAGLSAEVVEAEEEAAQAKAYRKLVAGLCENVERDAALLSRELSRRIGRAGPERRDGRWGGA